MWITLLAKYWKPLVAILIAILIVVASFFAGNHYQSLVGYKEWDSKVDAQKEEIVQLKATIVGQNQAIEVLDIRAQEAQKRSEILGKALAQEQAKNQKRLDMAKNLTASSCFSMTQQLQGLR